MNATFKTAAVTAIIAFVLPVSAAAFSSYPEIDETASWLAQRPVQVKCLTVKESAADPAIAFWGASAYVPFTPEGGPADYTVFGYGVCERLRALFAGTWQEFSFSGLGWAVFVITHESGHLRGWAWWGNEGRTNTWAVRHVRYTALHLGASDDLARGIRSWATYWCLRQPFEYKRFGCA